MQLEMCNNAKINISTLTIVQSYHDNLRKLPQYLCITKVTASHRQI